MIIIVICFFAWLAGFAGSLFFAAPYNEPCAYNDWMPGKGKWGPNPLWTSAKSTKDPPEGGKIILSTGEPFDGSPYWIPEVNYTTVSYKTSDGVTIKGTYSHGYHCAPVVILSHGRGSCRHTYRTILPAVKLWRAGFNVLQIDLRNHGESGEFLNEAGNKMNTYGATEHKDIIGAFNWLHTTMGYPTNRIGAMGVSMGGGTVTIAASVENRLSTVWVDSPVCDTMNVLVTNIGTFFGGVLAPVKDSLAGWVYDYFDAQPQGGPENNLRKWYPMNWVSRLKPTQNYFIMGNTGDAFVPMEQAKICETRARDAGANVTSWWIDDIKEKKTRDYHGKYTEYQGYDTHGELTTALPFCLGRNKATAEDGLSIAARTISLVPFGPNLSLSAMAIVVSFALVIVLQLLWCSTTRRSMGKKSPNTLDTASAESQEIPSASQKPIPRNRRRGGVVAFRETSVTSGS